DVHALGHSVLDALLVDDTGVEKPAAPPGEAALRAACGRYLDPESATTLELSLGEDGEASCTMYGTSFALLPAADGRLAAHRGVFPLVLALAGNGREIRAELDAGIAAVFRRVDES